MARPRKWASESERVAAYRERKAAEADVDPELPVIDVTEEPESVLGDRSALPGLVSLDDYVSEGIRGAEIHFAQTNPNATASTTSLAEQIERAEQYARWRYQGFLAGEVVGL